VKTKAEPAAAARGPSQADLVLTSMGRLDRDLRGKGFTLEDLAVQAWKMFPSTFGLKGFTALYPDFNKLKTIVYGVKGLKTEGHLIRLDSGLWTVSAYVRTAYKEQS
jgi:hypothetical protein